MSNCRTADVHFDMESMRRNVEYNAVDGLVVTLIQREFLVEASLQKQLVQRSGPLCFYRAALFCVPHCQQRTGHMAGSAISALITFPTEILAGIHLSEDL